MIGNMDAFDRYDVTPSDIVEAEARIGRPFPEALKELWLLIGSGFIQTPMNGEPTITQILAFLAPDGIADLIEQDEGRYTANMPFFDLADDEYFVLMPDGSIEREADPGNTISPNLPTFVSDIFIDPFFCRGGRG